ncbi:hypothetical protein, partial [Levilactobacillus koreensis]|uniref:hypothetical protein n=1 Tax=Levilactobacillus koreensis TaxID=637971 RepID=UPI001F2078F7
WTPINRQLDPHKQTIGPPNICETLGGVMWNIPLKEVLKKVLKEVIKEAGVSDFVSVPQNAKSNPKTKKE